MLKINGFVIPMDNVLFVKKFKITDFKLAFFGQKVYTDKIRKCGVDDEHLADFTGSFLFFRLTGLFHLIGPFLSH